MVLGSPGGARIPLYVVKTLVAVLDWGYTAQDALDAPNFANRYGLMELEDKEGMYALGEALHKKKHTVSLTNLTSGVNVIKRVQGGLLEGATDPRREGRALGN
jgi:gamma-glutamyltranspeptidase/glutathione hydrolase